MLPSPSRPLLFALTPLLTLTPVPSVGFATRPRMSSHQRGAPPNTRAVCSVQAGYDRSTERAESFVLPTLQRAFGPELTSYELIGERIVQPNAVGMKLRLPPTGGEGGGWPSEVFLKQVLATDYVGTRRDWSDLRRTLLYARTELRFYRDVLPIMNGKGFHAAPRCYHARYDFEGWIDEDEHATAPAAENVDAKDLPDASEKGGWLVLECISDDTHTQDSPLSVERAEQCLRAAAELHASAWEDRELLRKAYDRLSRAAFNLRMRNPKELAGLEGAWDSFCSNFEDDMKSNGLWTDRVRNMGCRMKSVAKFVSEEVTPHPDDKYATVIHGDYKAMNVMMGIDPATTPTIMIDMASASTGFGMSDVAMHIHHAVDPELLDGGGEERLVECYLRALRERGCEYPEDAARRHYRLAVIDYARFFAGRMWKTATPDTMAQKKNNKNIANINRSIPAAMRFVKIVDRYLAEIEDAL